MLLRSICSALVVAVSEATPASAQASSSIDLKARCAQLLAYFDRYGTSRGEHSDGARNMTRISAGIDCDRGQYRQGIAVMEELMRRKKFAVPPP